MKIGFLFNHDAEHQVAHTAPIISELVALGTDAEISVLTSSDAQRDRVAGLLSPDARGRVRFVTLSIGTAAALLDRIARQLSPFRRMAVLRDNLPLLAGFDALVVPETTSTLLKTRYGLTDLKLIYLPHGAGDRAVGFKPVTRLFDLVLLSGRKVRDRMLAEGLIDERNHAIVGYPKFDTVDLNARPRFFASDRPVVLYNPHFDPQLSSWYEMGIGVLDWFAAQDRFALIFAPHVMLFERRIHASLEHHRLRIRRDLPARFAALDHILIDTGSRRSVDMSYTLGADIYLGDASSQVYEWIARPRPCIFLDSHGADWRADPNYAHWQLGEVVDDLAALPSALDRAAADPGASRARQADAFEQTFSLEPIPSSRRAALAIDDFLSRPAGAERPKHVEAWADGSG